MSGEAFTCEACGWFGNVVNQYGQKIKREHNGETVCVSCAVDRKVANGGYCDD